MADVLLLILSSPSGAGKTTLTRRLLNDKTITFRFSVSHTTRKPRTNEVNGQDYHFTDEASFRQMAEQGLFAEWAYVHGNYYGTSVAEIERAKGEGAGVLLFDIDYQGARQIRAKFPDAVGVFILPPSMEILLERLRGRASEDEATVQRRFRVAREEIAHYGLFDYVLVNADLDKATLELTSIFRAEWCRRRRAAQHAERLLSAARDLPKSALLAPESAD